MKHILMLYHNFYLQNLDNQLYDSKYDSIAFRGIPIHINNRIVSN